MLTIKLLIAFVAILVFLFVLQKQTIAREMCINPFAVGAAYMHFQANYRPNKFHSSSLNGLW